MRPTPLPAALLAALLIVLVPATAQAGGAPADDPALQQQIDPDQEVVDGDVVLDDGHVDLGPRFRGGSWELMVHDDTRIEGSVWRELPRTVIQVLDAAVLQVPDDPTYEFLGVAPGDPVHVVPQTQKAGVVWLGWNTQDPEVMSTVDRGVTLSLQGVEGPGELIVYLQDGGFGDPDVLWDSRHVDREGASGQELWVDVNTHTHANWVFSEPGVYLVRLEARADLVDGSAVTDIQTLRFAVGDQTDPADALAAAEPEAGSVEQRGADRSVAPDDDTGGTGRVVLILVLLGAALLVAAVIWVTLRSRRVKAAAVEEGAAG